MVQVVSGEEFRARAEDQYTVNSNYFDRGVIFFTNKDGSVVPAASIKTGYVLHLNPTTIGKREDLEQVYASVNAIYPVDKSVFLTKAKKEGDTYEELGQKLPPETAELIQELKIPGLSVTKERWRTYPGEEIAAHTVGLIGYRGDELAGRYGLERFYESTLDRSDSDVFINFFAEIFSNIKSVVSEDESLKGDIVTTIEPTVEAFLETELARVTDKYSSEFTGGIIINPKTGAIYAMALDPTFDPNLPQMEKNSVIFSNKLVEDRYEMGSIIKSLTLGVGLDSGVITPKSTYNDQGCMTLNTRSFCNYDGKSHGTSVSMQTMLSKSLNTGAAYIALKMGSKNFGDSMMKFGLDRTTGIDLPNEGNSLVSNLRSGRELEAAQASFGQGIALTPINTVRALSALANGGTLINPHLVREVRYKIGTTKKTEVLKEEERERVISREASEEVSRMMTESVDRHLREGAVRLENHSVAAKTGTAQIAREGGGGYYDDRYLHSFFGYFPSYDPEFLIFLYTYYPKNVQYASETLTDSFIDITKFLINYYNIPPDREGPPQASI